MGRAIENTGVKKDTILVLAGSVQHGIMGLKNDPRALSALASQRLPTLSNPIPFVCCLISFFKEE